MIGAGSIAIEGHVPAYRANDDLLEVVAVVDPDARRREAAVRLLANPAVASVGTLAEALDATEVDVAVVATPPADHATTVIDALGHHVAVICEKPLCLATAELESIRSTLTTSGGRLTVLHNYLHKPGWRLLFEMIASGDIGEPVTATFQELSADHWQAPHTTWRRAPAEGGGPLWDNLYHAVYLAERIFSSPVADASATQAALVHPYSAGDFAALMLRHTSGAVSVASSAWCHRGRPRATAEVLGTRAAVRYSYWDRPHELEVERGTRVKTVRVREWSASAEWGYVGAFRDAVTRLVEGAEAFPGIDDAARVIAVLEGAGEVVRERTRAASAKSRRGVISGFRRRRSSRG
jgi:predicted dehydrogenase